MTLKTYKPYTKSTRGTIILDRTGLWKGKPIKSLTSGINGSYGRNNLGRITSRHRSAGHKKSIDLLILKEISLICQPR